MWRRVDRNVYCNFDALGNNWMQIVELLTPPGVDTVIRRVDDANKWNFIRVTILNNWMK